MTEVLWDAPNQQVVRGDQSAPWDEGTGGPVAEEPEPEPQPEPPPPPSPAPPPPDEPEYQDE